MLLYQLQMPKKQLEYPELMHLPLIVLVIVRQAVGGRPIFRGEFVIEDFILLMALVCFVVPLRFKRLIGLVIGCLVGTTMTLIWTPGTGKFLLVVFALLTIYSAVLALIELSNLRQRGVNGVGPQ
jgi:hypothetical protein